MTDNAVLAFSGLIGSGKTTIASVVATVLGWRLASFGDYVRSEAQRRGYDPATREVLQDLGHNLASQGLEGFCRAVLEDAGWRTAEGLVIDGVRHLQALDVLRTLVSPLTLHLVYVQIGTMTRVARLRRGGYDEQRLSRVDQHETELQVRKALATAADFVVDGALPAHIAAESILAWLSTEETHALGPPD